MPLPKQQETPLKRAAFLDVPELLQVASVLDTRAYRIVNSVDELFVPHCLQLLRTPIVRAVARSCIPHHKAFVKLYWTRSVLAAERGVKALYLLHRLSLPPSDPDYINVSASVYIRRRQLKAAAGAGAAAAGAGGGAGGELRALQDGTPVAAGLMDALPYTSLGNVYQHEHEAAAEQGLRGNPTQTLLRRGAWVAWHLANAVLAARGAGVHLAPPEDGCTPLSLSAAAGSLLPDCSQGGTSAARDALVRDAVLLVARLADRRATPAQRTAASRDLGRSPWTAAFHLPDPEAALSSEGEQPLLPACQPVLADGGTMLQFTFAPDKTRAFVFQGMDGHTSHVALHLTSRWLQAPRRLIRCERLTPTPNPSKNVKHLQLALRTIAGETTSQPESLERALLRTRRAALEACQRGGLRGGYVPAGVTAAAHFAHAPLLTKATAREAMRRAVCGPPAWGGAHSPALGDILSSAPGGDVWATPAAGARPLPAMQDAGAFAKALVQGMASSDFCWTRGTRGMRVLAPPVGEGGSAGALWAAATGAVAGAGLAASAIGQRCQTWASLSDVGVGGAKVLGRMLRSDPGAFLGDGSFINSEESSVASRTLATAHEYSSKPSGAKAGRVVGLAGVQEVQWVRVRVSVDELFRLATTSDRAEVVAGLLADTAVEAAAVQAAQASGRMPLTWLAAPHESELPLTCAADVLDKEGPAAVGMGGELAAALGRYPALQRAFGPDQHPVVRQAALKQPVPSDYPTMASPQRVVALAPHAARGCAGATPAFLQMGYCAANVHGGPDVPYEPPQHAMRAAREAPGGGQPPPAPPAPDGPSSVPPGSVAIHDDDSDDGEVVGDGDKVSDPAPAPPSAPSPAPGADPPPGNKPGGNPGMPSRATLSGASREVVLPGLWAGLWRVSQEQGWVWVPAHFALTALTQRPAVAEAGTVPFDYGALATLAAEAPAVFVQGATSAAWWMV